MLVVRELQGSINNPCLDEKLEELKNKVNPENIRRIMFSTNPVLSKKNNKELETVFIQSALIFYEDYDE